MLSILYQDDYLIIINKPAKMLVHKSPIDKHETVYAMRVLRDQLGQHVYPVHRLDKPTSGVLIFALSSEIANQLSQLFETHQIQKNYLAVVRGYPQEQGTIDHPIKETAMFKSDRGRYEAKAPKEAVTHFKRLAAAEIPYCVDKYPTSRYALMWLTPVTGRQHQLRRHMKHLSHPIIGDPKYGKSVHNHFFENHFGVRRLFLHCYQIVFEHPVTRERISTVASLDAGFAHIIRELGWETALEAIEETHQLPC